MSQVCAGCDSELIGRSDRRFCSNACRQQAYRRRQHEADVERRGLAALAFFASLPLDGSSPSRNAATLGSRNEGGRG